MDGTDRNWIEPERSGDGLPEWAAMTEGNGNADGAGKAAMDAHSRYFIRSPGGKSSPHQMKVACLILRGLRICPEALAMLTDGVDLKGARMRPWYERE